MIEFIENGDIFESECEMLVNPVNMHGVMGKGLALEFKNRFPGIWEPYYQKCKQYWKLGEVLTLKNPSEGLPQWICCYPTKIHWRKPSNMDIIDASMHGLFDEIAFTGIHSIAIPALGAGLGTIPWPVVRRYLEKCPFPEFVRVKIYEPHQDPKPS